MDEVQTSQPVSENYPQAPATAGVRGLLKYHRITDFKRGILHTLLADAYSFDSRCGMLWDKDWRAFDDFLFGNPEIADKYGFITVLGNEPVGLVSWDPRHRPDFVEIGHNCIATRFKGNGYGKLQLLEALRRIRTYEGLRRIIVTTNANLVAPKNYEAVGFRLIQRQPNQGESAFTGDYLKYEIALNGDSNGRTC